MLSSFNRSQVSKEIPPWVFPLLGVTSISLGLILGGAEVWLLGFGIAAVLKGAWDFGRMRLKAWRLAQELRDFEASMGYADHSEHRLCD